MEKKSKSSKILFIVVFILVALSGGILGASIFKFYVDDYYFTPFAGELNLSGYGYNSSNLVIRDPKKVVVNQDLKTIETANQSRGYMVGIFLKRDLIKNVFSYDSLSNYLEDESSDINNVNDDEFSSFYNLKNPKAVALTLTADGWVMTIDKDLRDLMEDDIVAIDDEKNIYQIDKIRSLKEENLFLIHLVEASNLSPVGFADSVNLKMGESLVVVDYIDKQLTTNILDKDVNSNLVENSDDIFLNIDLSYSNLDNFSNPILFNMEGKAVAFSNNNSWVTLDKYVFFWSNFLNNNEKENFYPSLGLNYIDLTNISFENGNKVSGALVYPDKNGQVFSLDSSAKEAGIKEGDIIKAVDSNQVGEGNSLRQILSKYSSGEEIDLTIYRNNTLEIIPVTLKNNKKYEYKISE